MLVIEHLLYTSRVCTYSGRISRNSCTLLPPNDIGQAQQ